MEYVRGDRFGPDFTNRRAHSLQRFLARLSLHPVLRRADILHIFLESQEWNATMRSRGSRGSQRAPTNSNWISWLPSFGASTKAQVWIYGALALIVAFCSGLGIWFFIARRRKLRNSPRDDYEFELLNEDESEGLNRGEKGAAAGGKGRRTRGGELYDAFAGGSDDEEEFVGEGYHDQERSRSREDRRR
ncbi:hypothetical protein BN1708_017084, partial [Verticillium longisporum]